jgi:uncharacterized membrane protein
MTKGNQSSNLLIKILGSAALAGLVAIVALVWSIYSSHSEGLATERQLANQATQIAKQDVQIALNAEQNRLLSEQATIAAQKASIEDQLRTPRPTNSTDFAPTATAFAIQSTQIAATKQVIEVKQKQIEATQTAIAQPLPAPAVIVRANDVIPKIKGEDGEFQRVLNWWREDDYGRKDGQLNPSSVAPDENCFGMAWNTNEYGYHRLVVFQKPTVFTFADGGWYVKVCIPNSIIISPEDIGRIQADWLGKRYGIDNQPWKVIVLR